MPIKVSIPINGDIVYDRRFLNEPVGIIVIDDNHPLIMEDNLGLEFSVSIKTNNGRDSKIEHDLSIYLSDGKWFL